MSVFMSE